MTRNLKLRSIPNVDAFYNSIKKIPSFSSFSRPQLIAAIRDTFDSIRQEILAGSRNEVPLTSDLEAMVGKRAQKNTALNLRAVFNATGIILHTNLGRAPLSSVAAEYALKLAKGYSTLEYNPEKGIRENRQNHVEKLLTDLTGAEAALVVNNNAAALLLILASLCHGQKAVISRGELVEIGGSFRLPDIIVQGGATLAEVGTTNRTIIKDYQTEIDNGGCGLILKVHTSNYRILGYAERPDIADLSLLASKAELPLAVDLGSGSFVDLSVLGITDEPTVKETIKKGAALVCFSGDKLLGAAQAGLIVGQKYLIDRLKKHPLARALRIDKISLAVLESTLKIYKEGFSCEQIPVLSMLFATPEEIRHKAELLLEKLQKVEGLETSLVESLGCLGGGAAPEHYIRSFAVSLTVKNATAEKLEQSLRLQDKPVVGRLLKGAVQLDLLTIMADEIEPLASQIVDTTILLNNN